MPISTTVRRLDNGIVINADGLRMDETGLNVGGMSSIPTFEGNPNGSVTAAGGAICLGKGTTEGEMWLKVTTGTSNNEWFQVMAVP